MEIARWIGGILMSFLTKTLSLIGVVIQYSVNIHHIVTIHKTAAAYEEVISMFDAKHASRSHPQKGNWA